MSRPPERKVYLQDPHTLTWNVCLTASYTRKLKFSRVLYPPRHTLLNFANAKLGKIFENKEFFVLRIVNTVERSSFHPIFTYVGGLLGIKECHKSKSVVWK